MSVQRALPQSKEALLKSYTTRLKDDVKSMLENFEGTYHNLTFCCFRSFKPVKSKLFERMNPMKIQDTKFHSCHRWISENET